MMGSARFRPVNVVVVEGEADEVDKDGIDVDKA
jgi:hypothetical protein